MRLALFFHVIFALISSYFVTFEMSSYLCSLDFNFFLPSCRALLIKRVSAGSCFFTESSEIFQNLAVFKNA